MSSLRELVAKVPIPSKRSDEDDPRIEALRLALEMQTLDRGGNPWSHPDRQEPEETEPEII